MKQLVTILVLALVGLSACDESLCTHPDCDRSHAELSARCAEGFEGQFCDQPIVRIFLGDYEQVDGVCWKEGDEKQMLRHHKISHHPNDFTKIQIENSQLQEPFYAQTNGWDFEIFEQANALVDPVTGQAQPVKISGKGWVDLTQNLLSYQLDYCDCRYDLRYR